MTRQGIKVVSFDLDGTLVEPEYNEWVWSVGIPQLFAEKRGIPFDEAKEIVEEEYRKVGDRSLPKTSLLTIGSSSFPMPHGNSSISKLM